MTTVIVDWLGRGGITQTTEAWIRELRGAGEEVVVATRRNRELLADVTAPRGAHAILEHRELANAAAAAIRDRRPSLVLVQNYVIPPLELPVYRAAAAVGARIGVVIHDHRLHNSAAGTHHGLARLLSYAEDVFAHTRYVAARIHRPATLIPHPLHVGAIDFASNRSLARPRHAVHFGVLKRRYKGTDVVAELQRAGVDGWDVSTIGADGYVPLSELVRQVEHSAATVLPYRMATQSGAVVLAQTLGSVPIVSAVGGIPEQIIDGVTGILVPPGASLSCWRHALGRLADPATREPIAAAGKAATAAAHQRFAEIVRSLVGVHV